MTGFYEDSVRTRGGYGFLKRTAENSRSGLKELNDRQNGISKRRTEWPLALYFRFSNGAKTDELAIQSYVSFGNSIPLREKTEKPKKESQGSLQELGN